MKKIRKKLIAMLVAVSLLAVGCGAKNEDDSSESRELEANSVAVYYVDGLKIEAQKEFYQLRLLVP
jgi:hypothetical protein